MRPCTPVLGSGPPTQWTQHTLADIEALNLAPTVRLEPVQGAEMLQRQMEKGLDPQRLGLGNLRDKVRKKMDIPFVIGQTPLGHLLCARF